MNITEVKNRLASEKDDRGIENFNKLNIPNLISYGVGLSKLRKIAKEIKKNDALAAELRSTDIYEGQILACLIQDPKKMSRGDIDTLMDQSKGWQMSNIQSELLAKSPLNIQLMADWYESDDESKRRSAYGILYNFSKTDKKQANDFYDTYLDKISTDLLGEKNFVKDTMNNCLFTIGKKNPYLHKRCLEIATKNGKVMVDYGDNSCEALDCVKHLSNPKLVEKMS